METQGSEQARPGGLVGLAQGWAVHSEISAPERPGIRPSRRTGAGFPWNPGQDRPSQLGQRQREGPQPILGRSGKQLFSQKASCGTHRLRIHKEAPQFSRKTIPHKNR